MPICSLSTHTLGWYNYDGDASTEDSATYNMENYHEQFLVMSTVTTAGYANNIALDVPYFVYAFFVFNVYVACVYFHVLSSEQQLAEYSVCGKWIVHVS